MNTQKKCQYIDIDGNDDDSISKRQLTEFAQTLNFAHALRDQFHTSNRSNRVCYFSMHILMAENPAQTHTFILSSELDETDKSAEKKQT